MQFHTDRLDSEIAESLSKQRMAAINECYIVHNAGLKRVHSDCEESEYSSAEDELDTTFQLLRLVASAVLL